MSSNEEPAPKGVAASKARSENGCRSGVAKKVLRTQQQPSLAKEIIAEETTPLLQPSQTTTEPDQNPSLYRTISRKSSQDVESVIEGSSPSSQSPNQDEDAATLDSSSSRKQDRSVFGIISVLLIGVFVSQTDITLVMATYAQIASDFGELERGSWVLSSYLLASCVTQPMYGKFSDIFGRKSVLQLSYITFAIGTLGSGLAGDMTQMIVARVVQGAGGAGMVSMVSILLTDLVPLQEVAVYRSYVNIFSTVGRSCGGLIGGYFAQWVGWRWAFLSQCPLLLVSIALVWWRLEEPKIATPAPEQTGWAKWKRIDFLGAFFMSLTILPVMLAFDMGGQDISWNSPLMIIMLAVAIGSAILFCLVETYWAREPIFPLKLLGHYVVVTSYIQLAIQTAIQVALMFLVPLYFQATNNASTGEAGAHLVPSIVGNTVGGLAVGAWIKRTGRYKLPTVLSTLSAILCFTLLIILWRPAPTSSPSHFTTSTPASLVIFFGGLGAGMAQSAVFVGLTAGIEKSNIAIAASGLYLSSNVGAVAGVSAAGAIFQNALRSRLESALSRESDGSEIIRKVLSDVGFLRGLHGRIHAVVVSAFVFAVQRTFSVALGFAGVAFVVAVLSRQVKIGR